MVETAKKRLWKSGASPDQPPKVVRYGVGLDVHKYKIAVCVTAQLQPGDIVTVKEHVFSATPNGVTELTNFLQKYQPVSHYLMECTGVYHLPVYYAIQSAFPDNASKVVAMNPLMLHRRVGDLGQHADRTDAQGLSTLTHYDNLVRPSYIGTLSFFRLRQTIRLYHRNKVEVTRVKNRIKQVLDAENLKMDLDLGSEWGLRILDCFSSKSWTFKEAFDSLVDKLKKQGHGTRVYEKRWGGFEEYATMKLNQSSRFLLQMHLSQLLYMESACASYLIRAEQYILGNQELSETYRKLLQIPSFGAVTALTLVGELGDYRRFSKWQAFTKYCGVVPIVDQSGERKVKGHVNKFTNAHLRKVLTQAAASLINIARRDSDLGKYAHYQYRVRKLPYKKALLKVGHKLARTVYNVLVLQIPYDPNFEFIQKRQKALEQTMAKKGTMLETARTRALRRQVSDFFVANSEFLNSTSKYHLVTGFKRMLRSAGYRDETEGVRKK